MEDTITVNELIKRLEELRDRHTGDAPVLVSTPDDDWATPMRGAAGADWIEVRGDEDGYWPADQTSPDKPLSRAITIISTD